MADSPYTDIGTLYKFETFISQEDYKQKTGKEAPVYDANLPQKGWEDLAALASTARNMSYDILETTDTGGFKVSVGSEIPFDVMLVPRIQASRVNLMHSGTQPADQFGGIWIPVPLNKPGVNQRVELGKFNNPQIRNLNVVIPGQITPGAGEPEDIRELLLYLLDYIKAIGSKVGVKVV